MRRQILGWLNQLRARVELCISPILNGYFTKQPSHDVARLPTIEVYGLRGIPETQPAFDSWKKEARGWCYSLGFDLYPFNAYKGNDVIFIWAQDSLRRDRTSHRLLVIWEPYLRSMKADGFGSEKRAVTYYTAELLDAMLPGIAISDFLDLAQKNLEKLRQVTFRSMGYSLFSRYRMRRFLKLHGTLRHESLLLDRLSMEFEYQKEWIRYDMEQIAGLQNLEGVAGGKSGENLRDATLKGIEFRIDLLKKHLSLAMTSFSDYLTVRNMQNCLLL